MSLFIIRETSRFMIDSLVDLRGCQGRAPPSCVMTFRSATEICRVINSSACQDIQSPLTFRVSSIKVFAYDIDNTYISGTTDVPISISLLGHLQIDPVQIFSKSRIFFHL